MNTYTICTADGEFIADRVSREQINRLCGYTDEGRAIKCAENGELVFGARLIRAHKKRNYLYLALVDAAVIRAELRREFSATFRGAEDCYTVSKEFFSNDAGSGWSYGHNQRAGYYGRAVSGTSKPFRIAFKRRDYAVVSTTAMALRAPLEAKPA